MLQLREAMLEITRLVAGGDTASLVYDDNTEEWKATELGPDLTHGQVEVSVRRDGGPNPPMLKNWGMTCG